MPAPGHVATAWHLDHPPDATSLPAAARTRHRHSVEVWQADQLVGGLYGLAMGQLFFGESMFSRTTNASKVGFVTLVRHLQDWGFVLIDCQMPTRHLESLGARSIPRAEFATYLHRHLDQPSSASWRA